MADDELSFSAFVGLVRNHAATTDEDIDVAATSAGAVLAQHNAWTWLVLDETLDGDEFKDDVLDVLVLSETGFAIRIEGNMCATRCLARTFRRIIPKVTALRSIVFDSCIMSQEQAEGIFSTLHDCGSLGRLGFNFENGNELSSGAVSAVARLLRENSSIDNLSLGILLNEDGHAYMSEDISRLSVTQLESLR